MFITRLLIAVSLIGLSGRLAIGASLPAWTFIGSSNELTSVQQLSAVITPTTNNFMLVGIYNGGAAAILRLDDAGNKLFRTLASPATPGGMTCGGVAIDLAGNAVVGFSYIGSTTTFTFPNTNFSVFGGFIAKIDPAGNVLWQQFVRGGPPSQIKVDSAGNIYYAVDHTAQLFIGPDGSFGAPANAYGSTTLIKLASNGVPIWIRDISAAGYTGTVNTESFSVDNNSVFVTGQFNKGLTWGTNAVTATAYKGYLGRLNAADGSFGWSYIFGLNTSGSDCLVAGGNLWVNGSDGFGTKTIYKFQTNGTLVASVTPPFATGYFRALTNNDFAFIGFGYVHYSNDLSILYATTNLALAKSINLTNYFVYDINPAGDLYVTGNYGDQYGYRSAGKIRAPEYVANITVQPPKITNALTVFMGFTVGLTAAGTPPLSYQWQLNGTNLAGATSSSYTNNEVVPADTGNYTCIISNYYGAVTSSVYKVTVTSPLYVITTTLSQLVLLNNAVLYGTNILVEDVNGYALVGKTIGCSITNLATGWPASGSFDLQIAAPYNGASGNYVAPAGGVFGALAFTYNTTLNGVGAWYLNLKRFPNVSTNSIIHFYNGGWYFLETSSNPGSIHSDGAYTIRGGGTNATFNATPGGTASFSSVAYQWQLNGIDLSGATNAFSLTVSNVTVADAGLYHLVATGYNATKTLSVSTASLDSLLHVVSGNANPPPLNFTTVPANSTMNFSWLPGFVLQTTTNLSPANWVRIATNGPYMAYTTNNAGFFQIVPQ